MGLTQIWIVRFLYQPTTLCFDQHILIHTLELQIQLVTSEKWESALCALPDENSAQLSTKETSEESIEALYASIKILILFIIVKRYCR